MKSPGPIRAQIENIKRFRAAQLLAIAQQSIQDVVNDMQTPRAKGGNMPVDTGFLRNSLVSGEAGSMAQGPTRPDEGGSDAGAGVIMAIANMSLGDYLRFSYMANYAVYQELGANGRSGNYFMATSAKKFQSHVSRNAARMP